MKHLDLRTNKFVYFLKFDLFFPFDITILIKIQTSLVSLNQGVS